MILTSLVFSVFSTIKEYADFAVDVHFILVILILKVQLKATPSGEDSASVLWN